MKRVIVPSSWYFGIGYPYAFLFVLSLCGSYLWKIYAYQDIMPHSTQAAYLAICFLGFLVLLLLAATRAVKLAAFYVFSSDAVVRYVPFRLPKRIPYDEIRFAKVSCVIKSNYAAHVENLFLSTEFLSEDDVKFMAPVEKDRVIISLQISAKRCEKLCAILPRHISSLIRSEIQSFRQECRKFKKTMRGKKKKR